MWVCCSGVLTRMGNNGRRLTSLSVCGVDGGLNALLAAQAARVECGGEQVASLLHARQVQLPGVPHLVDAPQQLADGLAPPSLVLLEKSHLVFAPLQFVEELALVLSVFFLLARELLQQPVFLNALCLQFRDSHLQ